MVGQNEYRSGNRRKSKKTVSFSSQSPTRKKKRPQNKRKSQNSPESRRQNPKRRSRTTSEGNVIPFPDRRSSSSPPVKVRTPSSPMQISVVAMVRLMIFAVGIGAIAGTILAFIDPKQYLSQPTTEETPTTAVQTTVQTPPPPPPILALEQEAITLKQTFQRLASEQSQLNPGAFVVNLDSGEYVSFQGEETFSAASMIKVPILIAFFHQWDEGKVQLDERLTMTEDVKATEAGTMQYDPIGTQYVALETAAKMIIISDNTATNMIIKRLGGKEAVNELFAQWGLEETRIRNPLPDLEGTNTTTPKELVELLAKLSKGELVSPRSRDQIFRIMGETRTRTLLPQGLGQGATIAHKTGDIGSLVGDVGIIDRPSGKRYLAAIMVERPHNDRRANELIRQYSRATYQYFDKRDQNSFID